MQGNQIEILIRKATEVVANEGMEAPASALNLAATGLMVQRIDVVGQKVDDLAKALRKVETVKKPKRTIVLQVTSLAGLTALIGTLGAVADRILGK